MTGGGGGAESASLTHLAWLEGVRCREGTARQATWGSGVRLSMQAGVDGVQKGCFERPVCASLLGRRYEVMMEGAWRRLYEGIIGCWEKMALLVCCVSA